jgi:methylglutaconyl-CoA hydratase
MLPVTTTLSPSGVATLTLNRPDKHNALNGETVRLLTSALLECERDPRVRVVVLTGAGTSFCAGADIAHMRSMMNATEEQNVEDALLLARCLRTLDELERPVIARINGNAFGGGLGLIACADIAIAVDSARFALTEVRLGIVPAVISPYMVDAIGGRQARRLFLTAGGFDTSDASALGLIHFAWPADELDQRVEEQVDLLLRGGPEALRAAKKLIRRALQTSDRSLLADETARTLARLRVSPEGKEGLSSFLERRTPAWIANR